MLKGKFRLDELALNLIPESLAFSTGSFPLPGLAGARHLLGESLGDAAGVGDGSLLLRGQLLIHSEGVVIHHKGHQQGQEPGDQLDFLGGREGQREENKAIISHFMPPNGPEVL